MNNVNSHEAHQSVLLELICEFDRICVEHNIKYMLFAGSALGAVRHQGFIPWDDDLDVMMLRSEYDRFLEIAPKELGEKYFLQKEFTEHWPLCFSKLRKNGTTCLEKYHNKDPLVHQGIYIDIFPCDNARRSGLLLKTQYFASRIVLAKALGKRGYETNSRLKKLFIGISYLLPSKIFHRFALYRKGKASEKVHTFFGGTSKFSKGFFPRRWITETENMRFEHLSLPVSVHYDEMLTLLYGDYLTPPSEDERKIKKHAILIDTEKNYTEYANYLDGVEFDVHTRSIR